MSQENVEVVRNGIDAYNRRDLDAVMEAGAPDFVFDLSRAAGPVHGVLDADGFRSWVIDMWATFEEHWFEAHELVEVGDRVVVTVTAHATGRDGIEVTADTAGVYTLRDGTVTRLAMYQNRQDALAAARLTE